MSAPLLLFEGFQPGAVLGRACERVDAALLEQWVQLYPWDQPAPGEVPAGLSTVLLMRAYMRILSPRPPGNIHARQRIELIDALRLDEEVATEIRCAGKQLRKERRYVELVTRSTGERGRALFDGTMTLIWAA